MVSICLIFISICSLFIVFLCYFAGILHFPDDCEVPVADPGGGGGGKGGHAPSPWPVKNRPKKDGCHVRRLIFHVSWPLLSEVSGSATGCSYLLWNSYDFVQAFKLLSDTLPKFQEPFFIFLVAFIISGNLLTE